MGERKPRLCRETVIYLIIVRGPLLLDFNKTKCPSSAQTHIKRLGRRQKSWPQSFNSVTLHLPIFCGLTISVSCLHSHSYN